MAASFYKWLFIPLVAGLLTSFSNPALHPFHVSVTEINHNTDDKTLEISCKIFTDDFEKALSKKFNKKVDLGKEDMHADMDSLVKKYIASAVLIRPQGSVAAYHYIGYEIDKEATYCYFEITNIPAVSKIDITNTILYDLFDDQMNIMHVTVKGERKSDKVSYPSARLSFSF